MVKITNIEKIESEEKLNELQLIIEKKTNILEIDIEPINSEKILNDFVISQSNKNSCVYTDKSYKVNICLDELDIELYLFFIKCVEIASEKLESKINSDSNLKLLLGNTFGQWNFSICDKIMFGLPFTLHNIVFVPIDVLTMYKNTNDFYGMAKIIVHEKIHVGQRFNLNIWNNYVVNTPNINSEKWFLIKKNDIIFDIIDSEISNPNSNLINTFNERFITNPDAFYPEFKYVQKNTNSTQIENIYYGHYVQDKISKQIKMKFFILNIPEKKLEKTIDIVYGQEHPFESYAYQFADEIFA